MPLPGFELFLDKLDSFISSGKLEGMEEQIIKSREKDICDAVREQLEMGINGDGKPVYLIRDGEEQYDYAYETIRKKKKMAGLSGQISPISNYWTGDFYESLYVEVYEGGNFEVLSSDPKFNLIKARSGENIINLSPENMERLFGNGKDLENALNVEV
jgi:hypothetical protein